MARYFADAACTCSKKCNVVLFVDIIISWIDTSRRSTIDEMDVVRLFLSIGFRMGYFRLNWLVYYHAGCNTLLYWSVTIFLNVAVYHAHPSIPIDSVSIAAILLCIVVSNVMYLVYSSAIQCRVAGPMSAMTLTMAHATTTMKR